MRKRTKAQLQVGDEAPNFTCDTHVGEITFHDAIDGQFALLVSFPENFDPVATTELGAIAKLMREFDDRNVRVFALGVDGKANHRAWLEEVQELQECKIEFPLICDSDGLISNAYGLCKDGEVLPISLTAIIDIDRRVRYLSQTPRSVGRNFYEVLRAVDALQLATFHRVGTPANWRQGEDVFIQKDLSGEAAKSMFPKGFAAIREWFRLTPQPDIF